LQTCFGLVLLCEFKQESHGQAVRLLGKATAIFGFGFKFQRVGHKPQSTETVFVPLKYGFESVCLMRSCAYGKCLPGNVTCGDFALCSTWANSSGSTA
jgi:hypothetical protein